MPDMPAWRGPVRLRLPQALPRDVQMRVHDARDRHVSDTLLQQAVWEPRLTRLLQALLKPGDVFLDVGANIGYFTVLAAASVGPQGRVFAVEPEPDNLALLRENLRLNDLSAEVLACALSDTAGEAALFLNPDNHGDHSLASRAGQVALTVPLCRGDAVLPADVRIAVLKMDVQGAEALAWQGLMATIQRSLPTLRLLLEFSPLSLEQVRAGSGEWLLQAMADTGLPMFVVDEQSDVLVETTVAYLRDWLQACCADADEGFFNLLIGEPPAGFRTVPVCGC